jgi:hypothetical protein
MLGREKLPGSVTRHLRLKQAIDAASYLQEANERARAAALAVWEAGGGVRIAAPEPEAGSYEFVAYEEQTFQALRAASGITAADVVKGLDAHLLADGRIASHSSSGASGSFFISSADGLLIVKTVPSAEVDALLKLLPAYAAHVTTQPSLLMRIYGAFSISFGSVVDKRVFCLLVGSVLPLLGTGYGDSAGQKFDLKGSTIGRSSRDGKLLLDEDFRYQYPRGIPAPSSAATNGVQALDISIGNISLPLLNVERRKAITEQLARDAHLLLDHEIMDYSLLVSLQPLPPADAENAAAVERDLLANLSESGYSAAAGAAILKSWWSN